MHIDINIYDVMGHWQIRQLFHQIQRKVSLIKPHDCSAQYLTEIRLSYQKFTSIVDFARLCKLSKSSYG